MPKSLVLGNGNILLCFDAKGQLRDFYYHYIGLENHVGHGCVHRIGVFVDGTFSWLEENDWEVEIDYSANTMGSEVKAQNRKLGIELYFFDVVDNELNIFIRNVSIRNLFSYQRQCKIFFHQQFRIYDTSRRDTGYFDPNKNVLVHYEGRRNFVIGGKSGNKSFDEYSVGNYGIEGKEGTWRDAEDGILEKNAIEHGAVDSVLAFSDLLEAEGAKKIDYWITVAKSLDEAMRLHEYVLSKDPVHIQKHARNFWRAWVEKPTIKFSGLEESIIDFYKKSLFVIRTHCGNAGEIIASGDSDMFHYGKDTYAYVWPRDASFVAIAFDRAGYWRNTRKFFEFCADVISKEGYFYHKYRSDRSIGSSWHSWVFEDKKRLAIQEDETALVLFALWNHFELSSDLEFLEKIYPRLVRKAADFMCEYRDESSGLPKGSFDLWEQDFCSSTFTGAAVFGGLTAAGKMAKVLGKEKDSEKYFKAAKEIQKSLLKFLFNKKTGFFDKSMEKRKGKIRKDDRIDMSSFYGIFRFGVLPPNHKILKTSFQKVESDLTNQNEIGGVIRYVGDEFHRFRENGLSNPWFITTLWKAQYQIATATTKKELEETKKFLLWAMKFATPSGILSEQILADSGEQISASPLTWSHAEFVSTVLDYLEKLKKLQKKH
jgi:glucoamylase